MKNEHEKNRAIPLKELLEFEYPEMTWDVANLFESGSINMISAAPNNYKTWVLLDIALAIAKGDKIFGEFEAKQRGVLIVNDEDTPINMQKRMKMLMDSDDSELPIFFHLLKGFKINQEIANQILKEMKEKDLGFLILDPFSSMHQYNENEATEINKLFSFLKIFKREGITVLMAHHNRKTKSHDVNDPSQEMRGSSAISAALDSHLTCKEHNLDNNKFIKLHQVKLKADKKLEYPFLLKISSSEDSFNIAYHGEYDGKSIKQTDLEQKVIQALKNEGRWLSTPELLQMKLAGENLVRNTLTTLQNKKIIKKSTQKELLDKNIDVSARGASNTSFWTYISI